MLYWGKGAGIKKRKSVKFEEWVVEVFCWLKIKQL